MGGPTLLSHAQLAEYLRALAHESRLGILEALRQPRALADVRVAPGRVLPGENPERSMARQTVQEHVEKLVAVGLAIERSGEHRAREFVTNQQRLYQILEALHATARALPGEPVRGADTVDLDARAPASREPGPKLVVVHGLTEGKAFPLRASDLRGERGWVIGRRAGLHATLDYDPYVSTENAEIQQQRDAFHLVDLPESKNGTSLNWVPLDRGERKLLASGDVIGVGRSLLVFQAQ